MIVRAVIALAGKDLRLLMRDKGGAFVTFVFPLTYCVFFGLIFSQGSSSGSGMKLAAVDEDQSEQSAAFIQRLDASEEFALTQVTRQEAIDLVRRGQRVAYIALAKGFGEASGNILLNSRPAIEVGVDPARSAEAAMIQGLLTKYAFESMMSSFVDPATLKRQLDSTREQVKADEQLTGAQRETFERFFGELDRFVTSVNEEDASATQDNESTEKTTLEGWQPIEIVMADVVREKKGPKNSFEISFPQGVIWGVLGCCSAFGISIVIERTSGTLARLRVAPIGRTTILAGKALACFGSTTSLGVVLFAVGWMFFGVVPRSPAHLAISLVLISIGFVGIMMFISILGRTERSVSGMGWGMLLAMAMLGGGMVPFVLMPQWMQTLSHVSPVKWAILAMEGSVWRGFSTGEMLLPWAILLGVGVVFFAIGVRGFAWMDEG